MRKTLNPLRLSSVQTCTACPMLGADHCPSEGNPHAEVMFIGQSPGETEAEKGRPFCGPSGELLDFLLDEAELDRSEVYIANALKCHPPANRKAMAGELDICKGIWLNREIKSVNPKVIVTLGKDAFLAVLPPSKHGEFKHLHVIKSKKRTYLCAYHPSYFLRRGDIESFVNVGKTIQELLDEE